MDADPVARAILSKKLSWTWPSYFGEGRLRTEKGRAVAAVARRSVEGSQMNLLHDNPGAAILRSSNALEERDWL